MKHILVRHRTTIAHLIGNRIWLHPNVIVSDYPASFLHRDGKTMWNQQQLFRSRPNAIAFSILWSETESPRGLLHLTATMFPSTAPIRVPQVDPQTASGFQDLSAFGKYAD